MVEIRQGQGLGVEVTLVGTSGLSAGLLYTGRAANGAALSGRLHLFIRQAGW